MWMGEEKKEVFAHISASLPETAIYAGLFQAGKTKQEVIWW